jgi:hypothetical protein
MSAVPCTGLIDEARVSVDTSLLERAAGSSPVLAVGLVLALVGVGFAVRAAPPGHRAWSLLGLFAPLGAAFAWFTLQVRTELSFACVVLPGVTSSRMVAVAAGVATLSFVQLAVMLSLRAWKRELKVAAPVVLLSSSLIISASSGWEKRSLQREFERRINVAMPVPNVIKHEKPPEAHVGRSVVDSPYVLMAGRTEGLFFPSRVLFTAEARKSWGIDTVTLTPEGEGVTTVPIHLVQDLVAVDTELDVRGVRDEGPAWFPLQQGNRWEFVAVRGRGGALEKLQSQLERGKRAFPESSLTLEVTGEGERDGFHSFTLTETRKGAEPVVREVVRRNGELFVGSNRVASERDGYCQVTLLEPSWCTCVENRVSHCTVVHGDLGESLLRLFLGAVTLGVTEIRGMGDLGAGNEAGLLLTRWVIAGEARTLRAVKK